MKLRMSKDMRSSLERIVTHSGDAGRMDPSGSGLAKHVRSEAVPRLICLVIRLT